MAPVGTRAEARERALRATEMRSEGRTWQEIADELGYATRGAASVAAARLAEAEVESSTAAALFTMPDTDAAITAAVAFWLEEHKTDLLAALREGARVGARESAAEVSASGSRRDARGKAERALQMRNSGNTWDEVAQMAGYQSRQGAQQAVERLARSAPDSAVEG